MIDSAKVRTQFPSLARIHNNIPLTFLDAPAGTQVPMSVIDSISNYYKTSNANTHGEFLTTNETDKIVTTMRHAMAALLGAEGPETPGRAAGPQVFCDVESDAAGARPFVASQRQRRRRNADG